MIDLSKDMELVDAAFGIAFDDNDPAAKAWQRIRARLAEQGSAVASVASSPDRERVAWAMYDEDLLPGDIYDWDDATLEDRNYWRAKADAAFGAMGKTP